VRLRGAAPLAALCGFAAVNGCGYVGDPLPPALRIPQPVRELRASQVGDRLIIEFSLPDQTVEALPLKPPVTAEVRVGETVETVTSGRAELPVAQWVGQRVGIAARALADDKASAWSEVVELNAIAPLGIPADLRAEPHPKGVRLAWSAENRPGMTWRVFRGKDEAASVTAPEYIDARTEYGKPYEYSVEAVLGGAVSLRTGPVTITPEDKFPPEVPAGLAALPGLNSIELTWEPTAAPDLRGYRVYRFGELVGEVEVPAWSDKKVESGRAYAYAVSSVDTRGNESARSTPIELTAP
jgi:hypothetical protein